MISTVALRFSGHETFPLRLLWLKKVYDAVADGVTAKRTFQEHEAIARFGVGKNMAMSMLHWSVACGSSVKRTGNWRGLPSGICCSMTLTGSIPDPEDASTVWLIHNALRDARRR